MHYPEPIRKLIEAFLILPGIGRRTAERFVFSLMQGSEKDADTLAKAIVNLHHELTVCKACGQFSDTSPCEICEDSRRDIEKLCVVADSKTISTIEHSGTYYGRYFVLGGALNPIDGITAEQLNYKKLITKIDGDGVKEVILAFNTDTNGEATITYTKQVLKNLPVKITTLARGLTTGAQLEYADEATLISAFTGRREL